MTDKPRFSITLDDDLFDRIDQYQHENRIATRSQAIVKLIEIGYDVLIEEDSETAKNAHLLQYARAITEDERDLIAGYRTASAPVRKIMLDAARDALKKKNTEKSFRSDDEETA